MDQPRMLSGEELVQKGVTKKDATLPEIGLKDVEPNGSWLEQKQIQSALEARKHLVEVEKIEKFGSLSHAEWRDDLKLAEVTQQSGSYWQYLGHHIGKKLYLNPEEALYLMEINCLQLKHDEVTMSLQKAYSLLLCGDITLIKYKVFASLSRIGEKVYRHNTNILKDKASKNDSTQKVINNETEEKVNNSMECEENKDNELRKPVIETTISKENPPISLSLPEDTDTFNVERSMNVIVLEENAIPIVNEVDNQKTNTADDQNAFSTKNNTNHKESRVGQHIDVMAGTSSNDFKSNEDNHYSNGIEVIMKIDCAGKKHDDTSTENNCQMEAKNDNSYNKLKLDKLKTRKPTNTQSLHNFLESIPDLYNKPVVTVAVPSEDYVPKNIFTNKLSYEINMANIKSKLVRPDSAGTTYSASDVNNRSMRRIRGTSTEDFIAPVYSYIRIPRNLQYQPFFNANYANDFQCNNMFFQRPYVPNAFDHARFQFIPRSYAPMFRPYPPRFNPNLGQTRSRLEYIRGRQADSVQQSHLESLKLLITKLKHLISSGNRQIQNVQSFQRILNAYNKRYKTKLRLTDSYSLVDEDNVLETIEIEDDGEPQSKKPRLESKTDYYTCNLDKVRHIALKLKQLVEKGQAVAAHRRAFSNVIKVFNKSYDADVYLNTNYEVLDRKQINIDSSSDSDCVIDEAPIVPIIKKLRNPFSIFRRLSDNDIGTRTSEVETGESSVVSNAESIQKIFGTDWLPAENDFGRAEIAPKCHMDARIIDSYKHEFLFDFYVHRERSRTFENWVDLKIAFFEHVEETGAMSPIEPTPINMYPNGDISELSPIIKPGDSSNMTKLLEKLRIISTNKVIAKETSLAIDFDVYNRDVQNFRKTNPPRPDYRLICTEESSRMPSSSELLTLYSDYKDDVPIMFAVVGTSISYLQIRKSDLPIYESFDDLL